MADVLSQGPLPVPAALRYANDLAVELRDLHDQAHAYGKLTLHSVSVTEAGARLAPLRSYWTQAVPERDIQAFGGIFYLMLHGGPAPSTMTAADIRIHPSDSGPARLLANSTKLALRCLSPQGSRLTMQQVATELRLLAVMQRQEDANARPANDSPYPSPPVQAPPRPQAPPTWTPPIRMLIDVPGAVELPSPAPVEADSAPQPSPVPDPDANLPIVPLGPNSFGAPAPKAPAKESPAGGHCPKCFAPVVYLSRARSRIERLFERMKFPIVRCHRCYHRYVVIGRFKIPKDMPVDTARKFRPTKRHT